MLHQRQNMASNPMINELLENPKTAGAAVTGGAMVADKLLFNAYSTCGWGMTIFTYIFSIALVNAFVSLAVVDWFDIFDQLIGLLVKLVGLLGSTVTTYAIYKKTFRTTKRKKINEARRKHKEEIVGKNAEK